MFAYVIQVYFCTSCYCITLLCIIFQYHIHMPHVFKLIFFMFYMFYMMFLSHSCISRSCIVFLYLNEYHVFYYDILSWLCSSYFSEYVVYYFSYSNFIFLCLMSYSYVLLHVPVICFCTSCFILCFLSHILVLNVLILSSCIKKMHIMILYLMIFSHAFVSQFPVTMFMYWVHVFHILVPCSYISHSLF